MDSRQKGILDLLQFVRFRDGPRYRNQTRVIEAACNDALEGGLNARRQARPRRTAGTRCRGEFGVRRHGRSRGFVPSAGGATTQGQPSTKRFHRKSLAAACVEPSIAQETPPESNHAGEFANRASNLASAPSSESP